MPVNQLSNVRNEFQQFNNKIKDYFIKINDELTNLIVESDKLLAERGTFVAALFEKAKEQDINGEELQGLLDDLGRASFNHDHLINVSVLVGLEW